MKTGVNYYKIIFCKIKNILRKQMDDLSDNGMEGVFCPVICVNMGM